AGPEPAPGVLVPPPVRPGERLDRQVHLPHPVRHLAQAKPGRRRRRPPRRRLIGAQRLVELAEDFRGLAAGELRRGRVRSESHGLPEVLEGLAERALFLRPPSGVERRAGFTRGPTAHEQGEKAEDAEQRRPEARTSHYLEIARARDGYKQSFG